METRKYIHVCESQNIPNTDTTSALILSMQRLIVFALSSLDYFPAFRRTNMNRPSIREMKKAPETWIEAGLKTVLAQTSIGPIGP